MITKIVLSLLVLVTGASCASTSKSGNGSIRPKKLDGAVALKLGGEKGRREESRVYTTSWIETVEEGTIRHEKEETVEFLSIYEIREASPDHVSVRLTSA